MRFFASAESIQGDVKRLSPSLLQNDSFVFEQQSYLVEHPEVSCEREKEKEKTLLTLFSKIPVFERKYYHYSVLLLFLFEKNDHHKTILHNRTSWPLVTHGLFCFHHPKPHAKVIDMSLRKLGIDALQTHRHRFGGSLYRHYKL